MTAIAELAPNFGAQTAQVVTRVKAGAGAVLGNFYTVSAPDNTTLLATTFVKKDKSGKTCRSHALDTEDRAAAGIPKGGRSGRGVFVATRTGRLMFWMLTDLSVQGQAATKTQVFLGLKKLFDTADELKKYKGKYDVEEGTRDDFDAWYAEAAAPAPEVLTPDGLASLADSMGMDRREVEELVASAKQMSALLQDMIANDELLEDDPLDEATFELSNMVRGLLDTVRDEDVEVAKKKYDDAMEAADVDFWPPEPEEEAKAFGTRAKALATLREQIAEYADGAAWVERKGAQYSALEKRREKLGARYQSTMRELEKLTKEAGTPTPKNLSDLKDSLEDFLVRAKAFGVQVDEGEWSEAIPLGERLANELASLRIAILNLPWEGDLALEVSQGTYTGGRDQPLLIELDSEGVCQAMVLDWIGHGGSGVDGGTKKKGSVSIEHLRWQATYTLDKILTEVGDEGAKKVVVQEKGLRPEEDVKRDLRRLKRILNPLEEAISRAESYKSRHQGKLETYEETIAENGEILDDIRKAIRLKRTNQPLTGKLLEYYGKEKISSLEAQVLFYEDEVAYATRKKREIDDSIARTMEAVKESRPLVAALREAKEILDREDRYLEQQVELKMERAEELSRVFSGLDDQWRKEVAKELMIPDSALRGAGLRAKKGTGHEVALDSHGDQSKEIADFLGELLDRAKPGEPMSFSIGVEMKEGWHAIALRCTPPPDETATWDIEIFDPNYGGYRFSDVKRAVAFWVRLGTVFYEDAPWTKMVCFQVEPRGTSLKTGGVLGDDPGEGWDDHYRLLTVDLPVVTGMQPAPLRAAASLKLQKAAIDRLVGGSPTRLDYTMARRKLDRLHDGICTIKSMAREVHRLWHQLGTSLAREDTAHDAIVKKYDAALAKWEGADLPGGLDGLRAAWTDLTNL